MVIVVSDFRKSWRLVQPMSRRTMGMVRRTKFLKVDGVRRR